MADDYQLEGGVPVQRRVYTSISVSNADVTALSIALGISDRRVRDLVKEGRLTPHSYQPKMLFNLPQAIADYINFKTTVEDIDPLKTAKIEQTRADTKLKEAKAEKAEIELAEFKGMMHRAEDVEAITNDLVFAVRANILALPGRLAVDVAAIDTARECSGRIRKECNLLLNDLAKYEYNPDEYKKRVRERERLEQLEEEEIQKIVESASPSGRKRRKNKKVSPEESEEL